MRVKTQVMENELREHLDIIHEQAETLLHSMDLLSKCVKLDEKEVEKWKNLREALIDFRAVEIQPELPEGVMLTAK